MNIELLFKSINIGVIRNREADFPSYSGDLEYSSDYLNDDFPELSRVKVFIRLQAEYCELFDTEENVSDEAVDNLNIELEKYNDISDSNDWVLLIDGKKESILCPIIYANNEISWRN